MISIRPYRPDGPVPVFAVERCPQGGWAAFSVDPAGGVGPRASGVFDTAPAAEAWARGYGVLAEPYAEAA